MNPSQDGSDDEHIDIEKPSYTYWKRNSDVNDPNLFQPQKSSEGLDMQKDTSGSGIGSVWNKAGTWEEKHLTKTQIEEFFDKSLINANIQFKQAFQVNKIYSYQGDTYFVFIRGKIKFVYDCELKIELKGVNEYFGITTDVTLKEVNNHGLEEDFEFEYSTARGMNDSKDNFMKLVKGCQKDIQKMIKEAFEELRASHLEKK